MRKKQLKWEIKNNIVIRGLAVKEENLKLDTEKFLEENLRIKVDLENVWA